MLNASWWHPVVLVTGAVAVAVLVPAVLIGVRARRRWRGAAASRYRGLDAYTAGVAVFAGIAAAAVAGGVLRLVYFALGVPSGTATQPGPAALPVPAAAATGIYVALGVFAGSAVVLAIVVFVAHRAWAGHEVDDSAVTVRRWWRTRRVPLSAVRAVDARRSFVTSGLAVARLVLQDGTRRTLFVFTRPASGRHGEFVKDLARRSGADVSPFAPFVGHDRWWAAVNRVLTAGDLIVCLIALPIFSLAAALGMLAI